MNFVPVSSSKNLIAFSVHINYDIDSHLMSDVITTIRRCRGIHIIIIIASLTSTRIIQKTGSGHMENTISPRKWILLHSFFICFWFLVSRKNNIWVSKIKKCLLVFFSNFKGNKLSWSEYERQTTNNDSNFDCIQSFKSYRIID